MTYMYHSFLIHSSADGHLGCFHVLAIINSATMNTGVHVSFSDLGQTHSYTTKKPNESWQIKKTSSKPTKLKLINVISDAIWLKLIQLLETFTSSNWMWFLGAWHRWPTICCTMIQLTYNLSLRHCTLEDCRLSVAHWHVSFAPHSINFFN